MASLCRRRPYQRPCALMRVPSAMLVVLVGLLQLISALNFDVLPFSDKLNAERILIETATSEFSENGEDETKFIAGIYLWRDYINNLGGVCIGGSTYSDSDCKGGNRRLVSVVTWKLESDDTYEHNLILWFQDITSRELYLRPHILITPYGEKWTTIMNDQLISYSESGISCISFTGGESENIVSSRQKYRFSTWVPSSGIIRSLGDVYVSRYQAKVFGILVNAQSSSQVQSFGTSLRTYLEDKGSDYRVPVLRCTSEAQKPDGKNCQSDLDCPGSERCLVPIYSYSSGKSILENTMTLRGWLELFSDVDVIYYASTQGIASFVEEVKNLGLLPKALGAGLLKNAFLDVNDVNGLNSNIFTSDFHSVKMHSGKENRYMGTVQQYVEYLEKNFYNYTSFDVMTYGVVETNEDYAVFAAGSSIGITIQRLFEIESAKRGQNPEEYFGNTYYDYEHLLSFERVLSDEFSLCVTPEDEITSISCGDSVPCPPQHSCSSWGTFYGPISFSKIGMNKAGSGVILQITSNGKEKEYRIAGPSNIDSCLNNNQCSQENNYANCTCNAEFPAAWDWKKVISPPPFPSIRGGNGFLVFMFVVECCVALFGFVTLRRKAAYQCLPEAVKWNIAAFMIANFGVFPHAVMTEAGCPIGFFLYYLSFSTSMGSIIGMVHFINQTVNQIPLSHREQHFFMMKFMMVALSIACVFFILYPPVAQPFTYYVDEIIPVTYLWCPHYDGEETLLTIYLIVSIASIILILSFVKKNSLTYRVCIPLIIIDALYYMLSNDFRSWTVHRPSTIFAFFILSVMFLFLVTVLYFLPLFVPKLVLPPDYSKKSQSFSMRERKELTRLLKSPLGQAALFIFMRKEKLEYKYVDFYIEVEKHKKMSQTKKPDNEQRIFSVYLNPHANHLSIDPSIIESVQMKLALQVDNPFLEAQNAIIDILLQGNVYKMFYRSKDALMYNYDRRLLKHLKGHQTDQLKGIYEYLSWAFVDRSTLVQHAGGVVKKLPPKSEVNEMSAGRIEPKIIPISIQGQYTFQLPRVSGTAGGRMSSTPMSPSTRRSLKSDVGSEGGRQSKRMSTSGRMSISELKEKVLSDMGEHIPRSSIEDSSALRGTLDRVRDDENGAQSSLLPVAVGGASAIRRPLSPHSQEMERTSQSSIIPPQQYRLSKQPSTDSRGSSFIPGAHRLSKQMSTESRGSSTYVPVPHPLRKQFSNELKESLEFPSQASTEKTEASLETKGSARNSETAHATATRADRGDSNEKAESSDPTVPATSSEPAAKADNREAVEDRETGAPNAKAAASSDPTVPATSAALADEGDEEDLI